MAVAPLRALHAPDQVLGQHLFQHERRPPPSIVRQHLPAERVPEIQQQPVVPLHQARPPRQPDLLHQLPDRPLPVRRRLPLPDPPEGRRPPSHLPAGQRVHRPAPDHPRQVRKPVQRPPAPAEPLAAAFPLQGAEEAVEPLAAPEVVRRGQPGPHFPPVLPGAQPEPAAFQPQQQVAGGQPRVAAKARVPGAGQLHLAQVRPPHHIPHPAFGSVDHFREDHLRLQRLLLAEVLAHPFLQPRVEIAEPPEHPRPGRPGQAPNEQSVIPPPHRRLGPGPDLELQTGRIRQVGGLRRRHPGQQLVVEFERRRQGPAGLQRPRLQPLPHRVGETGARRAPAVAPPAGADVETGDQRRRRLPRAQVRTRQADAPLRVERFRQGDLPGLVAFPEPVLQLAQPVPRRPRQPPQRLGRPQRLLDERLVQTEAGRLPEQVHLEQLLRSLHPQPVRPDRSHTVPGRLRGADTGSVQFADGLPQRPHTGGAGSRQQIQHLVERISPDDRRHPVRQEHLSLDQLFHEPGDLLRRHLAGDRRHRLGQFRRRSPRLRPPQRRVQSRGRIHELRLVMDGSAALPGLHILVATGNDHDRVVHSVARLPTNLRVVPQRLPQRRDLPQVERGAPATTGHARQPQPRLAADLPERDAGEQPEGRAPVAHPGEVLDERPVEPRPLPRRPVAPVRAPGVVEAGASNAQRIPHGGRRQRPLHLLAE